MNLLIVDDEPASRVSLIRLCERAPDMRVVGEAGTGEKAIEAVESLRPDLTLLDANLPDMSGFDVLRALRRRQQRRTVLVTANAQDAPGAFAAGALDFLVKPVHEEAFSATILRARARGMHHPAAVRPLHVMTDTPRDADASRPLLLVGERERRLYPLDPCQIDYVESAGNYVTYHQAGVEYIARECLKRLADVLAPIGFVRIQRSLLLNVRAIAYAEPIGHGTFAFTLASGTRLHSGDAYRDSILAALPLRRRAPAH
jgi:two-component system, LytTR family, response regulator